MNMSEGSLKTHLVGSSSIRISKEGVDCIYRSTGYTFYNISSAACWEAVLLLVGVILLELEAADVEFDKSLPLVVGYFPSKILIDSAKGDYYWMLAALYY